MSIFILDSYVAGGRAALAGRRNALSPPDRTGPMLNDRVLSPHPGIRILILRSRLKGTTKIMIGSLGLRESPTTQRLCTFYTFLFLYVRNYSISSLPSLLHPLAALASAPDFPTDFRSHAAPAERAK